MLKASWIAFVDGLVDDDEKAACSKNVPNLRQKCQNYTLCKTKMAKSDTL